MVAITVTDALDSPGSIRFAKELKSSLKLRGIESTLLFPPVSQIVVDYNSVEAKNSPFIKEFDSIVSKRSYHIDIRSFDPTESGAATGSLDFIVANTPGVTDEGLNDSLIGHLNDFSEVDDKTIDYSSMYCSTYAKLVLDTPTICILLNTESGDLFLAAADEIAEVVEKTY
jgi:hypothetical protein